MPDNVKASEEKSKKASPSKLSHATSIVTEFANFIKKFGVIGLALGTVIGGAVTKLVASLVDNIIQPLIGKIVGQNSFSDLTFWDIHYGLFIGSLIDFLIILFVVYLAIRFIIARLLTDEEKTKLGF